MNAVYRMFDRSFCMVLALTAVLFVAGIVVLPGLGPTYADEA